MDHYGLIGYIGHPHCKLGDVARERATTGKGIEHTFAFEGRTLASVIQKTP